MPQATRRWIRDKVKSLHRSDALPFEEVLDAEMVEAAVASSGVGFNERIFTPFITLCLFLSQVIDPDHSCRAAVARMIVWMAIRGRKPCAAETGSYVDARKRLPLKAIVILVHRTARKVDEAGRPEWLWKKRTVVLVDGTTVSMPDTAEDQVEFPQSRSQGVGLGFPVARVLAIISLATGVVRDLAMGPYKGKETGEPALFRTLLDGLEAGEVVLGDRYFASYFMLAELIGRGVDGLFRMHQRRKFDFRRGRVLGAEDHVVVWKKPARPAWMDEETYARVPDELRIRELRFRVGRPGYRVDEVVLVTTMLDPEGYSKEELAELYHQRWNIELDLRSIKSVMQMDVLRCKSPEMVRKEVWIHILAYNLIRGVMAKAAEAHDLRPRQLSFKGALQTMTAFQGAVARAKGEERERLVREMLRAIAEHRVADRPGRAEPRANKRRPKPQKYLMEPRKQARKRLLQRKPKSKVA
jgi:hypothetical protein